MSAAVFSWMGDQSAGRRTKVPALVICRASFAESPSKSGHTRINGPARTPLWPRAGDTRHPRRSAGRAARRSAAACGPPVRRGALTVSSAPSAPTKTLTGSSYRATRVSVSSWERSPHSAANSTRKLASTARQPADGARLLGELVLVAAVVCAALAEEDHRADQEHHQRQQVHGLSRQERRGVAERDRDDGLHREGEADADPDQERAGTGWTARAWPGRSCRAARRRRSRRRSAR